MLYAFISMCPISCTRTQKRLTIPETLIKANIHISGSVKTYKDFRTRHDLHDKSE